jgi:serine/threonine-protein kinase
MMVRVADRDAIVADQVAFLNVALAGRYTVERELGRGGMATVYLAQDLKHRRPVAIKLLRPELAAALGAERFLREIEIAARLQHPHILPLYDSGTAENQLFYVMPYVDGESLRDRLRRDKQLSLDEAVRITSEAASALAYAHAHGIVHRDIKPENILLSAGTVVVADFGIARAISAAADGAQLTQTGMVVGTPAYMSPEQGAAGSDIDGRSDEYSLACVLYEMLVGQPPFTGPNSQAILARHSFDSVSPPSIVRNTVPDIVG